MKKLIRGVAVAVTLAVMSACAANTVAGSKDTNNFNVMADSSGMSQFGPMGGNFKGFMKDLNLTEDQKKQFEAMKTDMKNKFKGQKDSGKEFMNTLKTAFLSNSIDKASLKAKLEALKPANDDKTTYMANNIIKAYNILTPEQRTKIESKINDMEAKMSKFTGNAKSGNFEKMKEKRFDWFTKDLNLSDAQKTSLKALMTDAMPSDRSEMMNKAKTVKNSVLAELKSGNPSADKIKAILDANKPDFASKMDQKLDNLVKAHDILNAEQRQKLVDRLEKMHGKFGKGFHRGHNK